MAAATEATGVREKRELQRQRDQIAAQLASYRRIREWSGLLFGLFLGTHLLNTMLAADSSARYDAFQEAAAHYYQLPLVELALATTLLVHISLSMYLRFAARPGVEGAKSRRPLRASLHSLTGYILLTFISGHVFFTRMLPWWNGIFVGFHGVAWTLESRWWLFGPYYVIFASAGLFHALNSGFLLVASSLFRAGGFSRSWSLAFWLTFAVLECGLLAGIAGMSGYLYPIEGAANSPYALLQYRLGLA